MNRAKIWIKIIWNVTATLERRTERQKSAKEIHERRNIQLAL
jgi:hypothetical protein